MDNNLSWIIAFSFGIALAIHREQLKQFFNSWSRATKYILGIISLCLLNATSWARYIDMVFQSARELLLSHLEIVTSVGAAILVMYVLCSRRLQNILRHPVWLFYGRVSYSLYLVHLLVIIAVTAKAINMFYALGLRNLTALSLCGYVVTILVSTLLAWILYAIVENPSKHLGRYMSGLLSAL